MLITARTLASLCAWLPRLELAPRQSRSRSRLYRAVKAAAADVERDEIELQSRMLVTDDGGNVVIDSAGQATLKDEFTAGDYNREHARLMDDIVCVDLDRWPGIEEELYSILTELDVELSGDDAEAYDVLMTALEEARQDTQAA